jgi:hypothetical protein
MEEPEYKDLQNFILRCVGARRYDNRVMAIPDRKIAATRHMVHCTDHSIPKDLPPRDAPSCCPIWYNSGEAGQRLLDPGCSAHLGGGRVCRPYALRCRECVCTRARVSATRRGSVPRAAGFASEHTSSPVNHFNLGISGLWRVTFDQAMRALNAAVGEER